MHTSWLTPNQPYEDGADAFVERALARLGGARFLAAFRRSRQRRRGARRGQLAGPGHAEARVARRPRLLPGHGAVGPEPRRSRQPPAGRLRGPRAARRRRSPARVPTPTTRGAPIGDLLRTWHDGRIKLLAHRRRAAPAARQARALPRGRLPAAGHGIDGAGRRRRFRARRAGVGRRRPVRRAAAVRRAGVAPTGRSRSAASAGRPRACCFRPALRDRTFRHAITGAELRPTVAGDVAWLFLGEIFRRFRSGYLSLIDRSLSLARRRQFPCRPRLPPRSAASPD